MLASLTVSPMLVFNSNVNFSPELYVDVKSLTFSVGERISVLYVVSELVLKIQVSAVHLQ